MYVFIYSSYHLKLSFPHLVVIVTTLETPKNILCFNNNNIMQNDNSKQNHPGQEHYEQPYLKLFTNYQKIIVVLYLNQATPKYTGIENFKPKKYPSIIPIT